MEFIYSLVIGLVCVALFRLRGLSKDLGQDIIVLAFSSGCVLMAIGAVEFVGCVGSEAFLLTGALGGIVTVRKQSVPGGHYFGRFMYLIDTGQGEKAFVLNSAAKFLKASGVDNRLRLMYDAEVIPIHIHVSSAEAHSTLLRHEERGKVVSVEYTDNEIVTRFLMGKGELVDIHRPSPKSIYGNQENRRLS